jgi:ATP-binding cassette, subfamily C (CFTR/MRP), member 1
MRLNDSTQTLGYARTLQATDLWKLDEKRSTEYLSTRLDEAWTRRIAAAAAYNARLDRGEIKPGRIRRMQWRLFFRGKTEAEFNEEWREAVKRHASLAWSMNEVFGWDFWCAGAFKARIHLPASQRTDSNHNDAGLW